MRRTERRAKQPLHGAQGSAAANAGLPTIANAPMITGAKGVYERTLNWPSETPPNSMEGLVTPTLEGMSSRPGLLAIPLWKKGI